MIIEILDCEFSICKVADYSAVDLDADFTFVSKTDEEKSLVCPTVGIPSNTIKRNDGWRAFRIQGILDFSLIGILSSISRILADNQIGIFVISTFNTDYILVKAENLSKAVDALSNAGYTVE